MTSPCSIASQGVNDDIVTDRLKALGDLEDFVSQVAGFVTRT